MQKRAEIIKLTSQKWKFLHLYLVFHLHQTESGKRNPRKIVARAGTNVTLPCVGAVGEKSVSKIEKLTWKSGQTIIKFINGRPLEQNQRVSVRSDSTCENVDSHTLSTDFNLLFLSFLFFPPSQPFYLQRSLNPKNYSLHFNPVKLIDSGEYICTINDKPTEPIDLLVQDVPEAPGRPMITGFTSRSVNLSWAQVQEPKNAPVTDFILETRYVQVVTLVGRPL